MTLSTVSRYDPDGIAAVAGRAFVVGGSVAGLLAARVLADAYESVTIVEKDTFPEEPTPRPGVPQGAQIHALLEAGRSTIEDFFGGYGEDLLSSGGVLLDGATDLRYYDEGDFVADGPRRVPAYSASRPLFEHLIRERVTDRSGVHLRSGSQFVEYLTDEDATTVTGVVIRDRGGERVEVPADLVVDATGRASRTPTWLADHGYASPPVDEVSIDVAYSTIAIERPSADRRAVLAPASPPHTRGGAIFPVEGNRWLVNVHGVHGDHPPSTFEGFSAFAESLPVTDFSRLLAEYDRVSEDVAHYPFPSNRRRYYEAVDRFPDGLLVTGDAVASFNPVYGQGMSVAALEALALHHALDEGRTALPTRFFDRIADVVDIAWSMAVGADCQFARTTGPRPRGTRAFGWYLSRLTRKAHSDGDLRDALFRVMTMERPPTALLRPWIVGRVLRPGNLLGR